MAKGESRDKMIAAAKSKSMERAWAPTAQSSRRSLSRCFPRDHHHKMFPTLACLSKASRRALTPKRGNKDFYKGSSRRAFDDVFVG